MLEELVQRDLWDRIALQFDLDPHPGAVGVVLQVGDLRQHLLVHEVGDLLDYASIAALFHAVGKLGHHDRRVAYIVRAETDLVRAAVRFQPLFGVHLVGADQRAHLVVENLRRGSGQRREAGVLQHVQVLGQRHVEPARAFGHLERGEAVHVDLRCDFLHRAGDVDVVVAVEIGVDAALQRHLRGAELPRLTCPLRDVVERHSALVAPDGDDRLVALFVCGRLHENWAR